jgi:RNA polymerase sigma-70 factor (ECF subfamily)
LKIYCSNTDAELLLFIKEDDEKAFRILYERYWKKLLLQAFIKLRSTEEAEEIVQTIFINIWKRRHTIELKYSFHTYVASMLKYEVLRRLAIQKKEKERRLNTPYLQVVEDNGTLEWLDYEQLCDQIEKEVKLLPEKCRLVFRLSREEGLTEKQIGESLSIAPKTVQAHLGKALKQLRTSVRQLFCLFTLLAIQFLHSGF